ncbi:MAG: hypothetical protein KF722_05685 [Nitrospira sp.]|nr:hypothetical protein [Nitrospira sp.]
MINLKPASAIDISPKLCDRPITILAGRSHDIALTCKSILDSFFMAVTLLVGLSACASDSSSVASVTSGGEVINVPDGPKSNEMVDCLLPGQVRRLGTQMTYVTERHPIRTTKEDCTIRGGEQVLGEQLN